MSQKIVQVFLSQKQEKSLIEEWQTFLNIGNASDFLLAFQPLVINAVKKYQYYGIPVEDLIQEAWLGLCVALCKYDTGREVRFSSYARWWVNASCQDYVLRNWSIVRVGTTAMHKKLFFQLRYLKRSLEKLQTLDLELETANAIAKVLSISVDEVENMYGRLMQKDQYLDQKINESYEITFLDVLPDEQELIDSVMINNQQQDFYKILYDKIKLLLKEREWDILLKRKINEPPTTLDEISRYYGITKERVRQIENQSVVKIKKALVSSGVKSLN